MGTPRVGGLMLVLLAAACGEESLTPSGAAIDTTAVVPSTLAPTGSTSAPAEVREIIHEPTITSMPIGPIDTTAP